MQKLMVISTLAALTLVSLPSAAAAQAAGISKAPLERVVSGAPKRLADLFLRQVGQMMKILKAFSEREAQGPRAL